MSGFVYIINDYLDTYIIENCLDNYIIDDGLDNYMIYRDNYLAYH